MASRGERRRVQGFIAVPERHGQTARVCRLLTEVASELSDCRLDLVFAQERLPTHLLLRENLRQLVARSDFVLCCTDGQDPDVAFEAGLAFGLQKPFVLVILPETQRLPATFMGHFYVELSGDTSDHERLRSALARLVAGLAGEDMANTARGGGSVRLPRMGCTGGGSYS
jgi:hypothetical protein